MTNQTNPSKKLIWTGRIISALVVLYLLFGSVMNLMMLAPAVEGSIRLGYPEGVVFEIGLALFISTVLYAIPRTSVVGAILLTGYLGGATATHVRIEDPWFLLPVLFGVLVWAGLYLRDDGRLRALIPLRRAS